MQLSGTRRRRKCSRCSFKCQQHIYWHCLQHHQSSFSKKGCSQENDQTDLQTSSRPKNNTLPLDWKIIHTSFLLFLWLFNIKLNNRVWRCIRATGISRWRRSGRKNKNAHKKISSGLQRSQLHQILRFSKNHRIF